MKWLSLAILMLGLGTAVPVAAAECDVQIVLPGTVFDSSYDIVPRLERNTSAAIYYENGFRVQRRMGDHWTAAPLGLVDKRVVVRRDITADQHLSISWDDVGVPRGDDELYVEAGEFRFYLVYHLRKPNYRKYPGPCVVVSEPFRLQRGSSWTVWHSER